jgi:hypothetical protein
VGFDHPEQEPMLPDPDLVLPRLIEDRGSIRAETAIVERPGDSIDPCLVSEKRGEDCVLDQERGAGLRHPRLGVQFQTSDEADGGDMFTRLPPGIGLGPSLSARGHGLSGRFESAAPTLETTGDLLDGGVQPLVVRQNALSVS